MFTEQQIEERKLGIGGSDMPVILGLSTYKTPYQLYLEKTDLIKVDEEMSSFQYWGHQLEAIIREEFAKRNNITVEVPKAQIHPFHSFLRGNIDGFIPEWNAVLEIKSSSQFMSNEWGENGSDVIPLAYLVQVAHYCAITNADCAYIAVLIGGNDYREYKYTRDLELEETVIDAAKEFWNYVQSKTPPPPVNQIDLKLMFPRHKSEKTIIAQSDITEILTNLADTRLKIKELSQIEEKYKFNIMEFMQDSECLTDQSGKPLVYWKSNKRGTRTFLVKGI